MTPIAWLLAFAVVVAAWWVLAAVADTQTGSRIAVRAGAAIDLIRQPDRDGPPLLPPTRPAPPAAACRVRIDMTTGTAEAVPGHTSH